VVAREACGVFHKSGPRPDPDAPSAAQSLKALDLQTGEVRWSIPFLGPGDETFAGAMTTAGGLVFFSTREGQFMAADAKTGALLWHFNTGGTIRASPMTYSVGGKQYVAIVSKAAVFTFSIN
jgi:alcohol dehydrogenase (cytochrome c)